MVAWEKVKKKSAVRNDGRVSHAIFSKWKENCVIVNGSKLYIKSGFNSYYLNETSQPLGQEAKVFVNHRVNVFLYLHFVEFKWETRIRSVCQQKQEESRKREQRQCSYLRDKCLENVLKQGPIGIPHLERIRWCCEHVINQKELHFHQKPWQGSYLIRSSVEMEHRDLGIHVLHFVELSIIHTFNKLFRKGGVKDLFGTRVLLLPGGGGQGRTTGSESKMGWSLTWPAHSLFLSEMRWSASMKAEHKMTASPMKSRGNSLLPASCMMLYCVEIGRKKRLLRQTNSVLYCTWAQKYARKESFQFLLDHFQILFHLFSPSH